MNPRVITGIVGSVIVLLGLAGLFYPDRVMGVLGFAVMNPSHSAAALGEVRATYGGLFVVMGVYTLLAIADPVAHRARLLFVGLLWLGACAGRLMSVSLDGNPGLPGWGAIAFEILMGSGLVAAALIGPPAPVRSAPATAPSTPTAPPPPV